jgi:hypothetical protein
MLYPQLMAFKATLKVLVTDFVATHGGMGGWGMVK